MNSVRNDVRNVAIIAHVDHGKTTLVDALLRQSGNFRDSQVQQDTLLDSNPLERERGITILAKNVAINYVDPATGQSTKINLIDTPGHADFGGEVERVLSMADGVFLLVDAAEGAMPQTRFVLKKAFQHELRPIVVINKIDRPDARANEVLNEVFDLFVELGADDETLDFPVLYASGRQGIASWKLEEKGTSIIPVFEALLRHVPAPHGDPDKSLQIQISNIQYNDYVGRIGVGRIYNGVIKTGQQVTVVRRDGTQVKSKVQQLQVFEGLGRKNADNAAAGDIVALVGLESVDIGDSICDPVNPQPLQATEIEPPTLTMMFSVNDSPFVGKEGKYVTSRNLRERLTKELESNVALKVEETADKDAFKVSGRGLLHLGILIENMRREGFELSISKPHVIMQKDKETGGILEPIEYLVVDVPEKNMGGVMELVGNRKGELVRMDNREGQVHLEFTIPARGLIGLRTRMLTATQGQAIMHHNFHEYAPTRGDVPGRANGVMVSMATGSVNAFALNNLQERGVMFVAPGEPVYEGQVVAENARDNDMAVNPTTAKKLSNMRTTSSDENIILKPARKMTLEQALEYIEEDELVEATPQSIRLRKAHLTENQRKRAGRGKSAEVVEV
ncbi:MAG: elongation factor family GTP-binding protein [Phycisphaerales bacterium]|nr:elongation factor family GTP-binding protein [Phycisphaerales bacterium]MDB5300173.1 elongation factor family GTP-binding protein [Phycisphaerales bacterium]MDB5303698.1 elongation factor family GTP-binding protein [Phycisphaerales bacterium]